MIGQVMNPSTLMQALIASAPIYRNESKEKKVYGDSILVQISKEETPGRVIDIMARLLSPGCTASTRTKKKWRAAADFRLRELEIQRRTIVTPQQALAETVARKRRR